MTGREHTFVICAYKESAYLEECILSVKAQSVQSNLMMVTSTPNDWIHGLAEKYSIRLCINEGGGGIAQDWNFALAQARTGYVTIVHQDDVYEKDYLKAVLNRVWKSPKPLIAFTDYFEIRDAKRVYKNRMAQVKRLMLLPLRVRAFAGSRLVRRVILAFGDPICCPSVTYCLRNLSQPLFQDGFQSCEDWEAWEKISRQKGCFVYLAQPLVGHRIHEGSTTTQIIRGNARKKENYLMFCKFWPKWIAKLINHFYTRSEKSNELGG